MADLVHFRLAAAWIAFANARRGHTRRRFAAPLRPGSGQRVYALYSAVTDARKFGAGDVARNAPLRQVV